MIRTDSGRLNDPVYFYLPSFAAFILEEHPERQHRKTHESTNLFTLVPQNVLVKLLSRLIVKLLTRVPL